MQVSYGSKVRLWAGNEEWFIDVLSRSFKTLLGGSDVALRNNPQCCDRYQYYDTCSLQMSITPWCISFLPASFNVLCVYTFSSVRIVLPVLLPSSRVTASLTPPHSFHVCSFHKINLMEFRFMPIILLLWLLSISAVVVLYFLEIFSTFMLLYVHFRPLSTLWGS